MANEDIVNSSDIMATSAARTLYRRQQAESQVEKHKEQQSREVNKRYSDLKHQLDDSNPQQIMRQGLKSLDNYYDTKLLTDHSLTDRQKLDILNIRISLKLVEGIYVKMDVKGSIADNELRKEIDSLQETLDAKLQ